MDNRVKYMQEIMEEKMKLIEVQVSRQVLACVDVVSSVCMSVCMFRACLDTSDQTNAFVFC